MARGDDSDNKYDAAAKQLWESQLHAADKRLDDGFRETEAFREAVRSGTYNPDNLREQEKAGAMTQPGTSKGDDRDLVGSALKKAESSGASAVHEASGKGGDLVGGALGDVKKRGGWYASDKAGRGPVHPGKSGKAKNFLKKHWKKIASGGVAALMFLAILVLLQLGSLIIPNFTQHMLAWQFVRATRTFSNSANEVLATKLQIDKTTAARLSIADQTMTGLKDNTWGKMLRTLKPKKLVLAMVANDEIKINWNPPETVKLARDGSTFVRDSVASVEINGQTIAVPQNNLLLTGKPTLNPIQYMRDWIQYRKFGTEIKAAIPRKFGAGLMVRGTASQIIRSEIGGMQLFRWTKDEVKNSSKLDTTAAEIEETRRSFTTATNKGSSLNDSLKNAENAVRDEAQQAFNEVSDCLDQADCAKAFRASGGGITQKTVIRLNSVFAQSVVKKIIGALNPAYQIAVPLCLVYDAGIYKSDGVMKANSESAERQYTSVAAAADAEHYTQQHPGDNRVSAELMGGLVAQMDNTDKVPEAGTIYDSNVERKASGRPYDTSTTTSAQSSAAGMFSFDTLAAILPTALVKNAGATLDAACGFFTDPFVGGAIAVVGLAAAVIPGLNAVVEGGGQLTGRVIAGVIARELGQVVIKFFSKKELLKLGATIGATELATILAQALTMQHAGASTNGTQQGIAEDNVVDMGGEIYGQDIDRMQNYSPPMTTPEFTKARTADFAYMREAQQSQSFTQRYFALTNPDSLASHSAMSVYHVASINSFSSVLTTAARIFNPITLFSSLFGMIHPGNAAAAAGLASTDYGIVQVGWTADQENAYQSDPNYAMFYNQQQLEASGKEQEISDKYNKCFTEPMWQLLAAGDVQRDEEANVLDKGDCSPTNLGMNNPTYGNLVYRWRVSQRNKNALNQLLEIQDPGSTGTAPGANGAAPAPAPGTVIGANCASIGKTSATSSNPYGCSNSEVKCQAGTDAGVDVGYVEGHPYSIRLCDVQGVKVNAFIAVQINNMITAAATDKNGGHLTGSGFRTMDQQIAARKANGCPADVLGPKDANGFYDPATLLANANARPSSTCSVPAAPPGFSNHQMGLAVDWSWNGTVIGSHSNSGFTWLSLHAATYGFKNLPAEAWHWSVDGR